MGGKCLLLFFLVNFLGVLHFVRSQGIGLNCYEATRESLQSGVFKFTPSGENKSLNIYCDTQTDGGSWALIGTRYWMDLLDSTEEILFPTESIDQILNYSTISLLFRDVNRSEITFRATTVDLSLRLFIKDNHFDPRWCSLGGLYTTNSSSVSCSTNGLNWAFTNAKSVSCCPQAVGSHTCGSGNGWHLLHHGCTYNYGGNHPCSIPEVDGTATSGNCPVGGLNLLWLKIHSATREACQPIGACCGDFVCTPGLEDCDSCERDCGTCCGNGVCDIQYGENCENCFGDCNAVMCCDYNPDGKQGCMNRAALNFDPEAQRDDGSCDYGTSDGIFLDHSSLISLPSCQSDPLEVVFQVSDNLTISQVALGLKLLLGTNLLATLQAPSGFEYPLFSFNGTCSNLDWWITDQPALPDQLSSIYSIDDFSPDNIFCGISEGGSCDNQCGRFFPKKVFKPDLFAFSGQESLGNWTLKICGESGTYVRSQLSFPQYVHLNPDAKSVPSESVTLCPSNRGSEINDSLTLTFAIDPSFFPGGNPFKVNDILYSLACEGFVINITSVTEDAVITISGIERPFTYAIYKGRVNEIMVSHLGEKALPKTQRLRELNFQMSQQKKRGLEEVITLTRSSSFTSGLTFDLEKEIGGLDVKGIFGYTITHENTFTMTWVIEPNPEFWYSCYLCSPSIVVGIGMDISTTFTFKAFLGFEVSHTIRWPPTPWEFWSQPITTFAIPIGAVPIPCELRGVLSFQIEIVPPGGKITSEGSFEYTRSSSMSWQMDRNGYVTRSSSPPITTKNWSPFKIESHCELSVTPKIEGALVFALARTGTGPALKLTGSTPITFGANAECCSESNEQYIHTSLAFQLDFALGLEIKGGLEAKLHEWGFEWISKLSKFEIVLYSYTPWKTTFCLPVDITLDEFFGQCDLCESTTSSTVSSTSTNTYSSYSNTHTVDPCETCNCDCTGCKPPPECRVSTNTSTNSSTNSSDPPENNCPQMLRPPDCDPPPPCKGSNCVDPPGNQAGAWGDPHFTSHDGCTYDFQGRGEYIWVQVDEGEEIMLQMRQVAYSNGASVVAAVVVSYKKAERIGIYDMKYSSSGLVIDGKPFHLSPGCTYPVYGGSIKRDSSSKWTIKYESGFVMIVNCPMRGNGQCLMSITLSLPSHYSSRTSGVLGIFDHSLSTEFEGYNEQNETDFYSCGTDERILYDVMDEYWLAGSHTIFDHLQGENSTFYHDLSFGDLIAWESTWRTTMKHIDHSQRFLKRGYQVEFDPEPSPMAQEYCASVPSTVYDGCVFDGTMAVKSNLAEDIPLFVQGAFDYIEMEENIRTQSNLPPAFISEPTDQVLVDLTSQHSFNFTYQAVDPEGGVVRLFSSAIPENSNFDPLTGYFSFPSIGASGSYQISIGANDSMNATTFSFTALSADYWSKTTALDDTGSIETRSTDFPQSVIQSQVSSASLRTASWLLQIIVSLVPV